MTDGEREEADAALQAAQRRLHDAIHAVNGIMAIFKAEVDLAVESARARLEGFYEQYPEMKS